MLVVKASWSTLGAPLYPGFREKETVLGKVEKDKIGLARSKIPYYEDFKNRLQFLYSNNNFL